MDYQEYAGSESGSLYVDSVIQAALCPNIDKFEKPHLNAHYVGRIPYRKGREIQEWMVTERLKGTISDSLLLCEHYPILTMGKRVSPEDEARLSVIAQKEGVELSRCDRGGEITFHGPGQLVVYPVLSLKQQKLGVRDFVQTGLQIIRDGLSEYGIRSNISLNPAGVWVDSSDGEKAKIAHVGLRIIRGVTCHGFSVNLSGDLDIFSKFSVCGLGSVPVTSLAKELSLDSNLSFSKEFSDIISKRFNEILVGA